MSDLKERIECFCKTAYDVLSKATHGLTPQYFLRFDEVTFPSDKELVPACTEDETDSYYIYFNIPLIEEIYYDYVKFICYHEMCHVFCDEIYNNAEANVGTAPKQSRYDHKGHPRLFFILMSCFHLTDEEKRMQHYRHEIPYNYGYPSNRVLRCFSDWSKEVDTKWEPPEGLFENGTAKEIADEEYKGHKDLKSAMASINFYLNRGGDNIPEDRRKVIEEAKDLLRSKYD